MAKLYGRNRENGREQNSKGRKMGPASKTAKSRVAEKVVDSGVDSSSSEEDDATVKAKIEELLRRSKDRRSNPLEVKVTNNKRKRKGW